MGKKTTTKNLVRLSLFRLEADKRKSQTGHGTYWKIKPMSSNLMIIDLWSNRAHMETDEMGLAVPTLRPKGGNILLVFW